MNSVIKNHLLKWFICVLLAVTTLAVFARVAENNFITLDDMNYVVNNHHIQGGITWSAIKWAFSTFHSSNWHPLTWLSHMVDCRLYGLDPAGPHLTNLVFHVANTLLLFLLLHNLTARLWPSAFVSLLFAIHPMHVESVAWVSERKDVLSTFFFLLTLLAYARYVGLAKEHRRARWMVYGLALLLFALGLMANPCWSRYHLSCACWTSGRWPDSNCRSKGSPDRFCGGWPLKKFRLFPRRHFLLDYFRCPKRHRRRQARGGFSIGDATGTRPGGLRMVCSQIRLAFKPFCVLFATT